jgi:hypothetical protein
MHVRFAWSLAAVAAVLAAGCSETAVQAPPTTLAQAQALAAKTRKPILVDFATEW